MNEMRRPKLVAETDGDGEVTHVWLSMPNWKFARPVEQPLQDGFIARSEVYGASRDDVTSWLRHNTLAV